MWSKRNSIPGLTIKGYKFSEAGKGKSVPDQYAAILKRKIGDALVSGMDADTEENLAKCISSADGVANVRTFLGKVDIPDTPAPELTKSGKKKTVPKKIDNIRKLHEFVFIDKGVHVRPLATIGKGKTIPLQPVKRVPKYQCQEFKSKSGAVKRTILDYNPKGPILAKVAKLDDTDNGHGQMKYQHSKEELEMMNRGLFPCPNPACTLSFEKYEHYRRHVSSDLFCEVWKTNETMQERVQRKYISKYGISPHMEVDQREARKFVVHLNDLPEVSEEFLVARENLFEGHALPGKKEVIRFTPEQRKFMDDEFDSGFSKNGKARADLAAKKMHDLFPKELWLTEQQIKGRFSKLRSDAEKRVKNPASEPLQEEPSPDEVEAAAMELDYVQDCIDKQNVIDLFDNESDSSSDDESNEHGMKCPIMVNVFTLTQNQLGF